MWFGVSGRGLIGSLKLSTVSGLEFIMFAVSYINVRNDSSLSWVPHCSKSTKSMDIADRIWCSQTPPI